MEDGILLRRTSAGLLLCWLLAAVALASALPGLAIAGSFDSEAEYPLSLSGNQEGEAPFFTAEGLKATCSTETLSGTSAETSESVTVHPTFSGCSAFGFTATVTTTGCDFVLHAGAETAAEQFTGTADLACGKEGSIKVVAGTCEITIGTQSGMSSMKFTNVLTASPVHVTASATLSKIKYTKTKDGFLCPLAGTGAREDGTLNGVESLKASSGGGEVPFRVLQKTVLCMKEEAHCAAGERYNGNLTFRGAAMNSELEFLPAPGKPIRCASSILEGRTQQKEGTPLITEFKGLSFTGCTLDGQACNEVSVSPATATNTGIVAYNDKKNGDWRLHRLDITFKCEAAGAGYERCEYESLNPVVKIAGNSVASLSPIKGSFAFSNGPAGNTCPTGLLWTGAYPVSSPPTALYVSII